VKTTRQIAIADHLWEAFERIAREMGSERDVLVNQAMHVFARLNGFVVPGGPTFPGGPTEDGDEPVLPPPPLPRRAAAAKVLEEAERLEQGIHEPTPVELEIPGPSAASGLLLMREDGTPLEVAKDRFVIGRGRHCDLVIDSAKVSREHAVIVREGDGWFIEDLGSSNGTWHHRERVTKKRIADGDEYFICSEKIRCVLR
jgi:FHA domain